MIFKNQKTHNMHNTNIIHTMMRRAVVTVAGIAALGVVGIVGTPAAMAQDAATDIVVLRLTLGDKVYKASEVDNIAFGPEQVSMTTSAAVVNVGYDQLVSIRFNTLLGVSDVATDAASSAIEYDGTSVRASQPLAIYDICGRKALDAPSGMADVTSLTPGIYIVRAGVQTLKISKK